MPMRIIEELPWEPVPLSMASTEGIIEIAVTSQSRVPVRVLAQYPGTISPVPQLSGVDRVAFRIADIQDVSIQIFAQSHDGVSPFAPSVLVNVTVQRLNSDDSVFVRGMSVGGYVSAPLLRISRDAHGLLVISPMEMPRRAEGIVGWYVAQRVERGQPLKPVRPEILIDSSASMMQFAEDVEVLRRFLSGVYESENAPTVRFSEASPIAGVSGAVGVVKVDEVSRGRVVLVSDLPSVAGGMPTIVLGNHQLPQSFTLSSAPHFMVSDLLLSQLRSEEDAYDAQTYQLLDSLITWLENLVG